MAFPELGLTWAKHCRGGEGGICSLDLGENDTLLHLLHCHYLCSPLGLRLALTHGRWQNWPCAGSGLMHQEGLAFVVLGALSCQVKKYEHLSGEITWRGRKDPRFHEERQKVGSSQLSPQPAVNWPSECSHAQDYRKTELPSQACAACRTKWLFVGTPFFGRVCHAAIENWNRAFINMLNQHLLLIYRKFTRPPRDSDAALSYTR